MRCGGYHSTSFLLAMTKFERQAISAECQQSGDHALVMDGTSSKLTTAQLAQKPVIDGFFASVCCRSS